MKSKIKFTSAIFTITYFQTFKVKDVIEAANKLKAEIPFPQFINSKCTLFFF